MDLFTLIRTCVRRWYVFVPILALSVLGATVNASSVHAVYTVEQQVLVLPPKTAPAIDIKKAQAVNPFRVAQGGERTAAAALAQRLIAPDVSDQVRLAASGSYSIAQLSSQPGDAVQSEAILHVEAQSVSPKRAFQVVQTVSDLAPGVFSQMQDDAGSPSALKLQLLKIGAPTTFPVKFPDRTKGIVAIVTLGLLLAGAASILVDAMAARSRRNRQTRRDEKAGRH